MNLNLKLIDFFQSLRGTVWQERLLFLQQNTSTYRWVGVGVFVGLYLLGSLLVLGVCRKKYGMNVGAICFVPVVNVVVWVGGLFGYIFSGIAYSIEENRKLKPKAVKQPKEKKVKGKKDSFDSEGIDLF